MPAKLLMTWVSATKRWAKNYLGKSYSVSCRQLDVPPTKEASWRAANAWWEAKMAELTDAAKPPADPFTDNVVHALMNGAGATLPDQRDRGMAAQALMVQLHSAAGRPLKTPADFELAGRDVAEVVQAGRLPHDLFQLYYAPGDIDRWEPRVNLLLGGPPVPTDKTVGGQIKVWLEVLQASVAGGQMDPARYDSYRGNINIFRDWIGGNQPVDAITAAKMEQFQAHLLLRVAARKTWERNPVPLNKGEKKPGYAPAYAHPILGTVKRFVSRLADHGLISRPANLDTLRIEKGLKQVVTFRVEELTQLLAACTREAMKTRLYLLLMMNCGMYQSDISDLGRDEVDFDKGLITRPRSKTPDGPVVKYKLWPETLDLLLRFATKKDVNVPNDRGMPRVLLTERGKPLVPSALADDGRLVRTDNIKSAYRRLLDRLKIGRGRPLKCIRKTSATMLAGHPQYKFYSQYFLSQAPREVADAHYVVPSDEEFFDALAWLRESYGLGKNEKREESNLAVPEPGCGT